MRAGTDPQPEAADSALRVSRYKEGLGTAAAAMILLVLAACAVGPRPPAALPAPPLPASRPGPWGTTYAVYDPAIFGPESPLAELISAYRLRLIEGKLENARLLLNKSQRLLELWVGRRMVKAYRVQLGENPVGRKTRHGDSRTPEGEYFICDHRPSTYYRALWISYPNLDDARAGLEAGLITRTQFEGIAAAFCLFMVSFRSIPRSSPAVTGPGRAPCAPGWKSVTPTRPRSASLPIGRKAVRACSIPISASSSSSFPTEPGSPSSLTAR
jgi:hypothetical protein